MSIYVALYRVYCQNMCPCVNPSRPNSKISHLILPFVRPYEADGWELYWANPNILYCNKDFVPISYKHSKHT